MHTPVRYTPVRYTPMRHPPIRCTLVGCMPVRYVLIFESSFVVLDAEPGMSVLAAAALIAPIAECACGRKCLSNVPAPRHSGSIIELFLQASRRSNCSTLIRSLTAVGWPSVRCSLTHRGRKESDRGWRESRFAMDCSPPLPAKRTQRRIQHHKKFVFHCIVTDQLHSARVFSLDIVLRAIVYSSGPSLLARPGGESFGPPC